MGIPSSVNLPYYLPINPYALPNQAFDSLIHAYGIRVAWMKGHTCPCTYAGPTPGSADPLCQTCHGRGIYWDAPVGPFQALITLMHMSPSPDEPGTIMDQDQGMIQTTEPSLTIPYSENATVWQEASAFDIFVEYDATARYNAQLQVGTNQVVPYQQNMTIPVSGAVTTYNQQTHQSVPVSGYTVSGAAVSLPASYPAGTNFIVEYQAAPAYVAYRSAGTFPHTRPFGQQPEPRRFRLQLLDLWLRAQSNGDIPIFILPVV